MASEIIKEIILNHKDMQTLIKNQEFSVMDANLFLERYYNVVRCVEGLEKSRDSLKYKLENLERKYKLKQERLNEDWEKKFKKLREDYIKIAKEHKNGK